MKPQWLIETDVFDATEGRLVEECHRQGFAAKLASYVPYQSGQSYLDLFEPDSCVIFRGTLEFAIQVQREASWVPGVYYNKEAYYCSHYYPLLRDYLLAEEYIMIPYGDLRSKEEFIFDTVGAEGCVFIRPDSGHKRFTGKLIEREYFQKDVDHLGFYEVQPWEMCVLSRPRNIEAEWRFVVVDQKVVSGSMYRDGGSKRYIMDSRGYSARSLANKAALAYNPDRVWCIDICRTAAGNYYVLEIGCFSCAGLYACNLVPIVQEVSRVALEDWKEVNE